MAVRPTNSVRTDDGETHPAGAAFATTVLVAAVVPPVARPVLGVDDGAAADRIDRCVGGDGPVPGGVVVMWGGECTWIGVDQFARTW